MEFLVLGGILLLIVTFVPTKEDNIAKLSRCDIHNWAYDYKGDMVCNDCNFNPSTELNIPSEDDPTL